ncbi:hypothetical protein [Candidatus Amarolinea dominans]|uniref:hypothetical protein n=1 Tax=Candidatus Amarolinea dominans TaxID=3140696 RepID=UPI001D71F529|nr:hypothetical protein [Anaerolineae bacterium]
MLIFQKDAHRFDLALGARHVEFSEAAALQRLVVDENVHDFGEIRGDHGYLLLGKKRQHG